MAQRGGDPYFTLGVRPEASDQEVRGAYRRLVQLHHPDHNSGSAESARRFEEVQEAYAQIRQLRAAGLRHTGARSGPATPRQPTPGQAADPDLDARLANMERDLREAHLARERARQAARKAASDAAASQRRRPTDEELGYIKTDDSLSKIFADARGQLSEQLADLFDDAREEINRRRK